MSHFYVCALIVLLTLWCSAASSQQNKSLRGTVVDEQGHFIGGSSVFLSHTSKGVTTSGTGEFQLQNLPEGKYDLVVSAIGYETKVIALTSNSYPPNLQIVMTRKANELEEVVVTNADRNGWQKFGKYFFDNFIGTTRNAKFCKIVNRDKLRFKFSDKANRLTVRCDEPVIIENKLLGYRISFKLIEFSGDFTTNTVSYYGHPFFTEADLKEGKQLDRIKSNRREAYYGSLMHFMRAVYHDSVKEENFLVKATIARANAEKERVRRIIEDSSDARFDGPRHEVSQISGGFVKATTTIGDTNRVDADSMAYYREVMKERDTITQTTSLESLAEMTTTINSFSKSLFFTNSMEVIYRGAGKKYDVSEIMLRTPQPIQITGNGSYYSPTELITFRWWSEQEKMCNMLPLDYEP